MIKRILQFLWRQARGLPQTQAGESQQTQASSNGAARSSRQSSCDGQPAEEKETEEEEDTKLEESFQTNDTLSHQTLEILLYKAKLFLLAGRFKTALYLLQVRPLCSSTRLKMFAHVLLSYGMSDQSQALAIKPTVEAATG